MKAKRHQMPLRMILLSMLCVALLIIAAAFMGVSAADVVSPTDVSGSDVSFTDMDDMDEEDMADFMIPRAIVIPSDFVQARAIVTFDAAPLRNNSAEYGDLQVTLTTAKSVGETLTFNTGGFNEQLYVDWGDGNPVLVTPTPAAQENVVSSFEGTLQGNTVKIYNAGRDIWHFYCAEQKLTSLNISDTNMYFISCHNNLLQSIDLSQFSNLNFLDVDGNLLTSLDVSHNPELVDLYAYSNNLSSINLTNNNKLKTLTLGCAESAISSIDLSDNTELTWLVIEGTQITSLDISHNTKLESVQLYNNKITALDLSGHPNLYKVMSPSNCLTFSTLTVGDAPLRYANETEPRIITDFGEQEPITIVSEVKANQPIDLSAYATAHGQNTIYKWYELSDSDDSPALVTPATAENGVFTFDNDLVGKNLYCIMKNESCPTLRLVTTAVKITSADDDTSFTTDPSTPDGDETSVSTTTSSPNGGGGGNGGVAEDDFATGWTAPTNSRGEKVLPIEDFYNFTDKAIYEGEFVVKNENNRTVDIKGVYLLVSNMDKNKRKSVFDAIERRNKRFDICTEDIALYDISLIKNGGKVKLKNGKVKICLQYPDHLAGNPGDYDYYLYHQKDDGSIEEIKIKCKSDGIWFETKDFSPYGLIWFPKSVVSGGSPRTGESDIAIHFAVMLLLAGIGGTWMTSYRKKLGR